MNTPSNWAAAVDKSERFAVSFQYQGIVPKFMSECECAMLYCVSEADYDEDEI